MEEIKQIKEALPIPETSNSQIRKEMNHMGKALLFNTFLQIYVPVMITLFITVFLNLFLSQHQVYQNYGTNMMAFTTFIMIVTLIVAESAPFIICSQRLKIKMKDFFKKPSMSLKTILMFAIICLGVNAFTSLIVQGVQILLNDSGFILTTPDFSLGDGFLNQALMVFMLVIVAPIGEEFMLRGVCLKGLSKYGTTFSIIVTAFLFALLHGNFIQGIPTFFMGLILGYVTVRSHSILPAILIHFINNAFSVSESILTNYVPQFPIITITFLVIASLYFIFKYRSTFALTEKIENHNSCWKCFFTSYSMIIFILIYIVILILSVSPLSLYQI